MSKNRFFAQQTEFVTPKPGQFTTPPPSKDRHDIACKEACAEIAREGKDRNEASFFTSLIAEDGIRGLNTQSNDR